MSPAPSKFRKVAEPLTLFAIGLPLVWVGGSDSPVLGRMSNLVGDSVGALPTVCYEYGLILLLLSLLSYGLAQGGQPLLATAWAQLRSGPRSGSSSSAPLPKAALVSLILALLTGLLLRLPLITRPVLYDEAFNYLHFVNDRFSRLFYYPLPNNHILNTLLVKIVILAAGDSPAALRLPALASGLLLIPLIFRVCRKLSPGDGAGIFAAAAAAVFPYLVLYSTVCRGYALLCLLLVAMTDAALDVDGQLRKGRVALVALLGALGMLTMPSMLFAIAGIGLWMIALGYVQGNGSRQVIRDLALPLVGLTLFFTALLYLPAALVNGGLTNVMANRFFNPLAPADFLQAIPAHVAATLSSFSTGIGAIGGFIFIALAVAGQIGAWRRHRIAAAFLLPTLLAGCLAVFLLKRSIPFERTWIFLIPAGLITADTGFALLLRQLRLPSWSAALPAILAIPFSIALATSPSMRSLPDMGAMPEASALSEALAQQLESRDVVCANVPADEPVHYYLMRDLSRTAALPASAAQRLLFVQNRHALFHPDSGTLRSIEAVGDWSVVEWQTNTPKLDRFSTCWLPTLELHSHITAG